ncbi:MAG: L,D-transpeptidase [Prolixibacteraceae bacterium]|nr:L,D-transpeptidase [Prolixibacteraceae bacterium]
MKRKKKKIIAGLFLLTFLLFAVLVVYFVLKCDKPPVSDLQWARESISKAKDKNAGMYSVKNLEHAEMLYDSAMVLWKTENEKFFLIRDYSLVRKYASEAQQLSKIAAINADSNSKELKNKICEEIKILQEKSISFQNNFKNLPVENYQKQYSKGKLLLAEAKIELENKNYSQAYKKTMESKYLIETSYNRNISLLNNYLSSSNLWKKWVKTTIDYSRKNKTSAIVIDKLARKCYLYINGNQTGQFDIELGKNWMGPKKYQGDKSTPEGNYKLTEKMENGKTKYYKALLINYPNEEDKKRFNSNKKNGTLSPDKKIGSMIEIHGHGGQGADWTDGCIALSNHDMDVLFKNCPVGTPVTIVGSMNTLEEYMKLNK